MALDRDWLLGYASAERTALGRTVQYADPSRWEEASPVEGWRARDVLAHLAASEVAAGETMGGEAPAEMEEYRKSLDGAPFTIDEWNRWAVERRAEADVLSLALEWGRAADLMLARAGAIGPDEWRTRTVTWLVGDIKVPYVVQSRVAEWWVHGEDIRQAVDLEPRREHPPIYCVNDLAIRMLPYAFGLEGVRARGKSVRIGLEAAGGGTWHQGLEAGDIPADTKDPDAVIEGRADAFALVAAKRATPEVCLYEGLLQLGGDVELAGTVLRTVRYFA